MQISNFIQEQNERLLIIILQINWMRKIINNHHKCNQNMRNKVFIQIICEQYYFMTSEIWCGVVMVEWDVPQWELESPHNPAETMLAGWLHQADSLHPLTAITLPGLGTCCLIRPLTAINHLITHTLYCHHLHDGYESKIGQPCSYRSSGVNLQQQILWCHWHQMICSSRVDLISDVILVSLTPS